MFNPNTQSDLIRSFSHMAYTGWTNQLKIAKAFTLGSLQQAAQTLEKTNETFSQPKKQTPKSHKITTPYVFTPRFPKADENPKWFGVPLLPSHSNVNTDVMSYNTPNIMDMMTKFWKAATPFATPTFPIMPFQNKTPWWPQYQMFPFALPMFPMPMQNWLQSMQNNTASQPWQGQWPQFNLPDMLASASTGMNTPWTTYEAPNQIKGIMMFFTIPETWNNQFSSRQTNPFQITSNSTPSNFDITAQEMQTMAKTLFFPWLK
ncbi:MAG: hypothetical protein AAF228_06895 [Pseudomonadota bacterium]